MNADYSSYVWYNIIIDVTATISCSIVSIIIIKFMNTHICWPVGLMVIPWIFMGIKSKKAWSDD